MAATHASLLNHSNNKNLRSCAQQGKLPKLGSVAILWSHGNYRGLQRVGNKEISEISFFIYIYLTRNGPVKEKHTISVWCFAPETSVCTRGCYPCLVTHNSNNTKSVHSYKVEHQMRSACVRSFFFFYYTNEKHTRNVAGTKCVKFEHCTSSLPQPCSCACDSDPFKGNLKAKHSEENPKLWGSVVEEIMNHHQLLVSAPGLSCHLQTAPLPSRPGVSVRWTPHKPDRARHLSARKGGVSDTYQLYMPNTLFFCHLERSPPEKKMKLGRKHKRRGQRGLSQSGVAQL